MILNFATLQAIVGPIKIGTTQEANAQSFLVALNKYGARLGLNKPVNLARYLGQITHESHNFKYDREIWGPTSAQLRYDVRTDLGNSPERDGDGKLYAGRGPIQITGKANYGEFRDWVRKHIDRSAPDFVKHPHLVNTDPWEGLGPIWYWSTRGLNRFAEAGDDRTLTKRINGGLNGFADRVRRTDRAALVLLGHDRRDARGFQIEAGLTPDGKIGPKTRAKLHEKLKGLAPLDSPRPKGRDTAVGGVAAGVSGIAVAFWSEIVDIASKAGCWIADVLPLISSCGG